MSKVAARNTGWPGMIVTPWKKLSDRRARPVSMNAAPEVPVLLRLSAITEPSASSRTHAAHVNPAEAVTDDADTTRCRPSRVKYGGVPATTAGAVMVVLTLRGHTNAMVSSGRSTVTTFRDRRIAVPVPEV